MRAYVSAFWISIQLLAIASINAFIADLWNEAALSSIMPAMWARMGIIIVFVLYGTFKIYRFSLACCRGQLTKARDHRAFFRGQQEPNV